jgi:hypothetical protein
MDPREIQLLLSRNYWLHPHISWKGPKFYIDVIPYFLPQLLGMLMNLGIRHHEGDNLMGYRKLMVGFV